MLIRPKRRQRKVNRLQFGLSRVCLDRETFLGYGVVGGTIVQQAYCAVMVGSLLLVG